MQHFKPVRSQCWTVSANALGTLAAIAILVAVTTPSTAQEFLATGSYTGDWNSPRAITGLGFQPDLVIVKGDNSSAAVIRLSTMGPTVSRELGGTNVYYTDGISSLDAAGFTVGPGAVVNAGGVEYYWTAMKATSGVLDIGTYFGNGAPDHFISVGTYTPDAAIVFAEDFTLPWFRHIDMPLYASMPLVGGGMTSGGITGFYYGGINLGADAAVNAWGTRYHYVSWNFSSNLVTGDSFLGDSQDNREFSGVGLSPEYLLIKSAANEDAQHRTASLAGDMTLEFVSSDNKVDRIQALQPDGFQLGKHNTVNDNGKTIYWVGFANAISNSDLSVVLTADPPAAAVGDTVVYVIALENAGPEDANGVQVTFSLPSGVTYESSDLHNGSFSYPGLVWDRGTFGGGEVDSLWVTVTVDAGTAGTTLEASATVTGTGVVDPDPLNNSDTASVAIADAADLGMTHAVDNTAPAVGDVVRFVTRITNFGPGDGTGIEVTADRPDGLAFFSYATSTGSYAPGVGVWTLGDLAAGATDSLVLQGRVESGNEGAVIVHGVAITAAIPADPNPENDAADVALTIQSEADLAVALSVDAPNPAEGELIRLVVHAGNSGPNNVAGAEIDAVIPVGLAVLSAEPSVGSFESSTGLWELGPMASGAADSLVLSLQPESGTAGQVLRYTGRIHSLAVSDPDTLNNTAALDIVVQGLAPQIFLQSDAGEPLTVQPLGDPQVVLKFSITNTGAAPDTLESVTVSNLTTGSGTQAQLDSTWGSLWLAPNVAVVEPLKALPDLLEFNEGKGTLSGLNRVVGPGQTLDFTVMGAASDQAPDGYQLSVGIAAPADLGFAISTPTAASWPINSGHVLEVDGFTSGQIELIEVESRPLAVGSLRNRVLEFTLPPNGFLPDVLTRLNVVNYGSADAGTDIARMEAWADADADTAFDAMFDRWLGSFVFTGDRWELTGLAAEVPLERLRIFITVDITETATPAGNAIRLGIPGPPDEGIGMASANDGPMDESKDNPYTMSISVSDRIILTTQWIHSSVVYPDEQDLVLIRVEALNTYDDDRILQRLSVTNTTTGQSGATVAQLDATCRQLVLRLDGNGDGLLGNETTDPILGTGSFQAGRIDFSGLNQNLHAGVSAQFFVTADLNEAKVADGDRISAQITSIADVDITSSTIVAGWPLDSGARWSVDGMIADQLTLTPISVLTLGPSDGPALGLNLVVPANGYVADTLLGLSLVNTGSAGTGDLAGLELWADGGDGAFDAGAVDDVDLGPMSYQSGSWVSPSLNRTIPLEGLRLYAGLTVSATPQDSSTVRLAVPIGGITTLSGNSGPLDRHILETGTLVLSTSPLLSSVAFVSHKVTVGMAGEVRMTVSNRGGENVAGIVPELQFSSGTAGLELGAPVPASFDLDPGQEGVFTWSFTCDSPGDVVLEGWSSGTGQSTTLLRRSISTPTSSLQVYTPVPGLDLYPVTNLPFSINRGQTGVVPLTLTLINPGDEDVSDGRLSALRLLLKEAIGGPNIAPADLLTRIVISEGTDIFADVNVLSGTAGDFEIPLVPPVIITGSEPVTLGIRFDLRADSTLPSFLVAINQADWFTATDAISGAAVILSLGTGVFPVQSAMGNLVTQATSLEARIVDRPAGQAGPGQTSVILGEMDLTNVSADGTASAIELGSVAFAFLDSAGVKLAAPNRVFSRVDLATSFQNHYGGIPVAGPDSLFVIQLSPPLLIPGDATLTLRLTGDVADDPVFGPIRPMAGNAAFFDARDANTGAAVTLALVTGPIASATNIMGPAETLQMSGQGILPTHVPQGALDVDAMELTLRHPGIPGTAAIVVDSLRAEFFNTGRDAVDPSDYLDSFQILSGDVAIGTTIHPAAAGGLLAIALNGLVLEPGQEQTLVIRYDFRSDSRDDSLEMSLAGGGIVARDLVRGTPVVAVAASGAILPLYSGATHVVEAADELIVGGTSLMPAILSPQPEPFGVLKLTLTNPASSESGAVAISAVTIGQPDLGSGGALLGTVAAEIRATVGEQTWATVTEIPTAAGEVTLTGSEPLLIPAGEQLDLVVEVLLLPELPTGTFRVMLGENQITAATSDVTGTAIFIRAASGQTFPLTSAASTLAAADLASSYANYPNPFNAGKEPTTFVFSLVQDATVTLRILTPHGEPVATVLDGLPYAAGLHQDDRWSGYNDRGKAVRNGVYIAELVVEFADGTRERVLRKVAVVR